MIEKFEEWINIMAALALLAAVLINAVLVLAIFTMIRNLIQNRED